MSSKILSRLRTRLPMLVLAALAAALVVLPAVAGSETTPTVNATETPGPYGYGTSVAWSPSQVAVAQNGVVMFQAAAGQGEHGIVWKSGNPETPACSEGVPIGVGRANWSGTCTFARPGVYSFECAVHKSLMTGTITVNSNGTITPGPGSPSPEVPIYPPTGAGTESPSGSGGSPLVGGTHALRLAAAQHGASVHGSIDIASAGVGGKLEVALFARGASLAAAHRPAGVRVGRLRRSSVRAGVLSFTVGLSARARGALHRHHRLGLTVQIVLTPPVSGAPASVTRGVVLRG